jgi:hypothetical protein
VPRAALGFGFQAYGPHLEPAPAQELVLDQADTVALAHAEALAHQAETRRSVQSVIWACVGIVVFILICANFGWLGRIYWSAVRAWLEFVGA